MGALVSVILPVFLVIAFGFVALKVGWFSDGGADALMVYTQRFGIPCLLFQAIATLDLAETFNLGLLISFYTGMLTCFAIGLVGARTIFARPWQDAVVIGFACLFSNTFLLGLPITERAYGTEALSWNYALIAFHSPLGYLVGIAAMEIARGAGLGGWTTTGHILRGMLTNGLVIGILLGAIVNFASLPVPGVVFDAVDLIGRSAIPAALFGLGGILARYRPEGDMRVVAFVCAISLILHPAITFVMAAWFDVPDQALRSAVITAAMAPGVNAYAFANMYGRARRVAATTVLVSTCATVLTAWAWIQFLG